MLKDAVFSESDETRIARFQAGDKGAFDEFYSLYALELRAFFAARCQNRDAMADLCQSIWLKLWENRHSFEHGSFRAWMYRIANNHLIDYWRKKKPSLTDESFDFVSPEFDEEDPRLDALRECLESLAGSFMEVVRGRTQGLSTEELSVKHNIPTATVNTRYFKGKQLLRDCVERKTK